MNYELLVTALVAPAAALIGAFGGVVLTNRHSYKLEMSRYARERRELAREVGTDLLMAAGEVSTALSLTVLAAVSLKKSGAVPKGLVETLRNRSEDLVTAGPRLARATLRFRVTFADTELADKAQRLAKDADAIAADYIPKFLQMVVDGQLDVDWIKEFSARIESTRTRFSEFEEMLILRVAEPLVSESSR